MITSRGKNVRDHVKDTTSFSSIIRRTRVTTTTGANGKYAEYEIACQWRSTGNRVDSENVRRWSVWRRFSLFEKFHNDFKREIGWRAGSLEFPSSHTFVINKFSTEFLEKRRYSFYTKY